MNLIKFHENIIILREEGYSYGQISQILNTPKSTVSSYCLDHNIKPIKENKEKRRFLVCKECGGLFEPKTKRAQEFCSNKCRGTYWRREKAYEKALEEEFKEHLQQEKRLQELKNSLDFLPEESDRLYGGTSPLIICCKKEEK